MSLSDVEAGTIQRKTRVAIVATHPIQHFAPLYRALAECPELELKVFFCSRAGVDSYRDPDFGLEVRWETDLLAGYDSEFLPNAAQVRNINFWELHSPFLSSTLDAFQPDVVQIYGYASRIALQSLYWARRRGVPVIMMSDSELLHKRPRHVLAAKRALLPLLYRQVAGFLTIGDNNEAYLAHYGVSRDAMHRSPYPTNDAHFTRALERAADDRREVRRQLGIDEQAVVALFVGKLIERKRPADLLAATQLVRSRSALHLVALFAGDGELRASLETSNAGAARFAGFVNQEALPSMYAAADLIVHPAHNDPHPIAVTEGVLMGLPAVVSDKVGSVGPTDTVRVGQNGMVVPTGDVPALASALQTLAGDPELRKRMAEASSRIGREMGMTASVRGYLAAVRAVARSRRR